jgi:acyl dehydratase
LAATSPDPRAPVYFDDVAVGDGFESPEVEVTAEAIIAFARDYDPQPFHTDPEAAAGSVFRGHVASGWHTAALTMRQIVDHGLPFAGGIVGLGCDELRWGALRAGDRIRVAGEVIELRPSRSGAPRGVVRMRIRTLNQRDEEVQHMLTSLLVPTRGV